ncbi:MAG: InlB B-repeat-containing protein [Eubacteriales bacterium]|nr:InlB B-repeat-containing protein [Eubacteriales bacterium]
MKNFTRKQPNNLFHIVLAVLLICSMVFSYVPTAFASETAPAPTANTEGDATYYKVTYSDPSGRFESQEYTVKEGDPVPAFQGSLVYGGYLLTTWNSKYKASEPIKETVTQNRTFNARWVSVPAALDAATAVKKGQLRGTDEFRPNGGFDPRTVPLTDGTFTVNDTVWDAAALKYTATVTITDVKPYEEYMTGLGYTYIFNRAKTPEGNLVIHFANKLTWSGSSNYSNLTGKFGGWLLDSAYYPGSSRSQLIFNRQYSVTFKDGADGNVFADRTIDIIETAKDYAPISVFGTDPVRTGYTFAGWDAKSGTLSADGQAVTGNAVLTAQWNKMPDITITFHSNGGDPIEPKTLTYGAAYGKLPDAGYVNGLQNLGWYDAETNVSVTENTLATKDSTLIQKREIKIPSVKIERDRNPYNYTGEPVTLTAKVTEFAALRYSYQWYKDGEEIPGATESVLKLNGEVSDTGTYSVKVTAALADGSAIVTTNEAAVGEAADKKLTIRRTNNQLLYDANGGDGGPSNNFDYISDGKYVAKVQSTVPSRDGYLFSGWNTNADGTGDSYKGGDLYEFIDTSGNGGLRATLYAQWTKKVSALSVNKNTHTFDSQHIGYTQAPGAYTFTILSTGNQPVTSLAAVLGGKNADSFTLNTDNMIPSLDAAGGEAATTTFTVQPKAGLAPNTYTAVITVTADGGITETIQLSFTVTDHNFKWITDKKATEKKAGSKHEECTICGYKKDAVAIPATAKSSKTSKNKTVSAKTGDNSPIIFWISLILIAGAGLYAALHYRKSKNSR